MSGRTCLSRWSRRRSRNAVDQEVLLEKSGIPLHVCETILTCETMSIPCTNCGDGAFKRIEPSQVRAGPRVEHTHFLFRPRTPKVLYLLHHWDWEACHCPCYFKPRWVPHSNLLLCCFWFRLPSDESDWTSGCPTCQSLSLPLRIVFPFMGCSRIGSFVLTGDLHF